METEPCPCPIQPIGPSMVGACGSQFLVFMTILEAYINGRCDLADPCRRVKDKGILDDFYDFAVIGGGTAGPVVAARLSENPEWKVLLIEAGGDEPIPSSVPAFVSSYWNMDETDWNYKTVQQTKACLSTDGICSWHRGKMLGGCSVINGMMYMRGTPGDFNGWAADGAVGWSWNDVFPYFLKSEDNKEVGSIATPQYHNVGGPLPVRRIIVSGGTINTPQILLLSGVGPKETLDRFNIPTIVNLPGVGQNLQNHVGVNLKFTLTKDPDVRELNWATAMEYIENRTGPMSGTGLSQLTGKIYTQYAEPGRPDIQYYWDGFYSSCSDGNQQKPEEVDARRSVTVSTIALHPKSRGYVTLQSADPLARPLMQPNYFQDEFEISVLIDGAKAIYRLANTTLLREKYGMTPQEGYASECGNITAAGPSDDFLRCLIMRYTAPENHQVGTCKMGPAWDPMAVVDLQLNVFGVEGLRVMDASVMPKLISGNTVASIIMIAERGADFIKEKYQ